MSNKHKNLANCKPTEFLKQANRLRKAVEKFMTDTQIAEIRKEKVPGIEMIPKDATPEEAAAIRARNIQRVADKSNENTKRIIAAVMENDDVLGILALACFVEPENVDDYSIGFYLRNLSEIMSDQDVIGFFTSLVQLEQIGTLKQ